MRALPILLAATAALLAGTEAGTAAERIGSAYTRHDYERCPVIEADDVAPGRRCAGLNGIAVNWVGEDDGTVVDFGTNGQGDTWPYGSRFPVAGTTIEWRGVMTGGRLEPYAAIVRFDMASSVSGPYRPELMVFHLDGAEGSCVAGSVDGRSAGANARARALADEVVRHFACGTDRPRLAP